MVDNGPFKTCFESPTSPYSTSLFLLDFNPSQQNHENDERGGIFLLREFKDRNRSAKFEIKEDHDLKYAIRSLAYNILYGKARCVDRLIKKLKEIMDGPVNPHIQTHQRDAENQATGQTPQAPTTRKVMCEKNARASTPSPSCPRANTATSCGSRSRSGCASTTRARRRARTSM